MIRGTFYLVVVNKGGDPEGSPNTAARMDLLQSLAVAISVKCSVCGQDAVRRTSETTNRDYFCYADESHKFLVWADEAREVRRVIPTMVTEYQRRINQRTLESFQRARTVEGIVAVIPWTL